MSDAQTKVPPFSLEKLWTAATYSTQAKISAKLDSAWCSGHLKWKHLGAPEKRILLDNEEDVMEMLFDEFRE